MFEKQKFTAINKNENDEYIIECVKKVFKNKNRI